MRNLIYVPVAHPIYEGLFKGASFELKSQVHHFNEGLEDYFSRIAVLLGVTVGSGDPIHKIYLESWDGSRSIDDIMNGKLKSPVYKPVRFLMKDTLGKYLQMEIPRPQLMPTEHPVFVLIINLLMEVYGADPKRFNGAEDFLGRIGNLRVEEVLEMVDGISINGHDCRRDLEVLCSGEEIFDRIKIADRDIARRINDTLLDNERGALIIGSDHKIDKKLQEMGSDIQISYLRVAL